jgi:hypothetical protein
MQNKTELKEAVKWGLRNYWSEDPKIQLDKRNKFKRSIVYKSEYS